MAQAFDKVWGSEEVEAYSAGSRPSGKINPKAIAAMAELGYDLSTHDSKSLDEIPAIQFDYVVTMGCGDACPIYPGKRYEDWDLADPAELDAAGVVSVRNDIEARIRTLLTELKVI